MPKKSGPNAAKFLYENGLLFEINRRILHPFGLALHVELDEDDKIKIKDDLIDYRQDPEGIVMSEDSLKEGKAKFNEFLESFGTEQLERRQEALGYVEQE